MSVPTEEVVRFVPEPTVEYAIPEADPGRLDFIPGDPAELRRAVTDMAARINLADWRFVKLIAAMARTRSWREGGYCNLGNWLDHQCGLGPCAARERIRIGRALERLPLIDAAFRDGVISYSKVRAITRVATPHTDAMLLAIAEGSSAAQLESLVRTYERVGGSGRKRASSEQRRSLTWHYEDGMLVITAAVPAERGALVINALQQVVDGRRDEGEARDGAWLAAMGQKGTAGPAADDGSEEAPVEGAVATDDKELPAQSEWTTDVPTDVSAETPANNVVRDNGGEDSLQIESATLTDADVSGDVSAETDGLPNWLTFALSSREQRYADALVDMAEHCLATRAGAWKRRRTGRRYEVVLTIGRNELAKQRAAGGARYHVERDWGVDQEDARHIACDADLTEYIQDAKGDLLNYERRSRIVPARLLRALKLRDQNRCRFPGCAHQRYVEAHHVRHWIDGGETCLENLVLLCSAHHRLLHHGAYHIVMEDGDVVFVGRNGEVMPPALSPQFPGVSAELPPAPIGHDAADCPLPTRRSDVLRTHSDREVVDMLHHRQDWGRQKNARFQKELMKLAGETW
ncbi:MAG: DUF222 domain-containing protein [Gammaproteobacteria bacterium]|nr:DUF222 domain-containing protein [Gammaproteobacteria bacterium]